jgi:RsiW-degrading membrane proteinase PrsW (M82 family)
MNALQLFALALAPGCAIILYIYRKDKHEREPLSLLAISFIYGILSTAVTFILSWPLNTYILLQRESLVDEFYSAFFKVALVEEFSKFLFVRFVLFRNRNFNEPFDGIVYTVMVGMGFASLENVLYVFQYGFETAIWRMFTAVPAHATFAILMGFFLGKAKFAQGGKLLYMLTALFAATFFHGSYDYFWFIAQVKGTWAGIWLGAIASLVVGILLSRSAIRVHQQASPFVRSKTPAP